jgi:Zn-dependent peptidase ImmA (M78 family)
MRRLATAGFDSHFVHTAILPDWWDDELANDRSILPELEMRVARFLGVRAEIIRNPDESIPVPHHPGAHLRRVRDVNLDRLAPAIHAAIRIATAATRHIKNDLRSVSVPPLNPLKWRECLSPGNNAVGLESLLVDLWARGIPVIPAYGLPTPGFQGLACVVNGHPVVLLGYKYDEPGRAAFLVAHEIGHIAAGDCSLDQLIVDEDEELEDDSDIEKAADKYAMRLLLGQVEDLDVDARDFRDLAKKAISMERERGVDAGILIWAWARKNSDYATARLATRALYRTTGAIALLKHHFKQNVDLDSANEVEQSLMRCIFEDSELDEIAD